VASLASPALRENANGARAKSGGRTVPVGPELIRLYADYLHEEYGGNVFVNIWAEPKGHAWAYQAAYDLVLRIRARTGIAFDPHWFRHSTATRLRDGVAIEVVSKLLGALIGDHDVRAFPPALMPVL
jgi:site-specific recombinase XerD